VILLDRRRRLAANLFAALLWVASTGCSYNVDDDVEFQRYLKQESARVNGGMSSWQGESKHALVMAWGMPARTADDGDGGEIVAYYFQHRTSDPGSPGIRLPSYTNCSGYQTVNCTTTGGQTILARAPSSDVYYCERFFYVNRDGRIYNFSWKGVGCGEADPAAPRAASSNPAPSKSNEQAKEDVRQQTYQTMISLAGQGEEFRGLWLLENRQRFYEYLSTRYSYADDFQDPVVLAKEWKTFNGAATQ
jgi:hypothetical protein